MIRNAQSEDLDKIYTLYSENSLDTSSVNNTDYASRIQREGFLIALEDKADVAKRIQSNFLFHVWETQGKIKGFININKEIYFPENATNIIWFDASLKDLYFHSDSSIALHEIIVDKKYQGKGIAKSLLENSIPYLENAHINHVFSIVTLSPLTNCTSLLFHTRNAFKRACVTMPIDLFGLKNYQSILFYKKIA